MPVFIVRKGKNAIGMVWCKFVESGKWSGWVSGVDTPLTVMTTSAPAVLINVCFVCLSLYRVKYEFQIYVIIVHECIGPHYLSCPFSSA